ncbi:MAG: hypothetical protein HOO67_04960 [Candidatus Peribacteraceae bacterium]|nr:hypothetical protein [Candidatus Peribacteraceae bacterium]
MNTLLTFLRHGVRERAWLRRPYILVLLVLLLGLDAWGAVHAFRSHGNTDGIIAVAVPPYGLYRGVESAVHKKQLTDADIQRLSQSDEGRLELAQGMHLQPDVWETLLALIAEQKTHAISTVMEEAGMEYDITAAVEETGPVTLTIRGKEATELSIDMIDEDRDQEPESLRITKQVSGKPDIHLTALSDYDAGDSSQFLLAWALAWGTIADELKGRTFTISQ